MRFETNTDTSALKVNFDLSDNENVEQEIYFTREISQSKKIFYNLDDIANFTCSKLFVPLPKA